MAKRGKAAKRKKAAKIHEPEDVVIRQELDAAVRLL